MITPTASNREPWNKGKIVGHKAPFKLKEGKKSGQFGFDCSFPGRHANLPSSTWGSTASYVPATSSLFAFETSAMAIALLLAQSFFSEKRIAQYSSR